MPYRAQILTTPEDLADLQDPWDALFERADQPYLSQSHEWARCVWDATARPLGGRLHCIAVWSGDEIVLLWPVVVDRLHRLWTVARPLAATGDYAGVLLDASTDQGETLAFAWDVLRRTCRADLVLVEPIKIDTALHQFLWSQGRSLPPRENVYSVAWDAYENWDSYYRGLARRKTVERHVRRLGDCGTIWFAIEQEGDRYRQAIDWLFRQKEDWFASKGHANAYWIRSRPYKTFLMTAPEHVRRHGRIVAFTLMLDGEIIAVLIASVDRFRVEYMQVAYDLRHARYSPGHVLTLHALEWAFHRRLAFDFRQGDFGYKEEFANAACALASHRFISSRWGLAHEYLRDLKKGRRLMARTDARTTDLAIGEEDAWLRSH